MSFGRVANFWSHCHLHFPDVKILSIIYCLWLQSEFISATKLSFPSQVKSSTLKLLQASVRLIKLRRAPYPLALIHGFLSRSSLCISISAVFIDCKQKCYSHSFITRLILLFDMTLTPHPIQRCSAGKKGVIQGYPGSIFHLQAISARA